MNHEVFLHILERELIPALGCTDPVGVAYASAYARQYAKGKLLSVTAELSVNIVKNAAAVCIPKTEGRCGVALAAALGAIGGKPEKGLEVLSDITMDDVAAAEEFVEKGLVRILISSHPQKLYLKVHVVSEEAEATITVENSYLSITSLNVDGTFLLKQKNHNERTEEGLFHDGCSLERILAFAETVPISRLGMIEEAVTVNMKMAEEGFTKDYGVAIGKNIKNLIESGKMSEDIANTAMMWTAAAADARMAGCSRPVISNTGSGNQGLASTIPVISIAKKMDADYETMIRAVTISSLVTIYMKEKLGELSPVCGAVIASVGTSCGVVYLSGGKKDHMAAALQNILGDITGMVCDGAKAGCALKVATCTNTAVMAALMAMNHTRIKGTDGIVGDNEEETINNYVKIATDGMNRLDQVILDIILKKEAI